MQDFPITSILSQLCQTLADGRNAVLTAPPGAGKTTQVPLALLEQPWVIGKKILVLEPRRLAARAAAHRMATLLGESVGSTVGYRMRLDSQIGPTTRIEVVTEGILTRLIQHDPSLAPYAIVLFDEFHERSLHADLGLTLCLETQRLFRPDLRLTVMSATLDTTPVAELLGLATCLTCDGQQYPVQTHYLKEAITFKYPGRTTFEKTLIETIKTALLQETGSLLVFLPGKREIIRTEQQLGISSLSPNVIVTPLYGDLSKEDQEQAISPAAKGQRKIVLATSIAETSLTIEGIRVVIDAGLMRVPHFDPRSGLTKLETIRITKDSADQRRGRAGRVESGTCFRLWTESQQRTLMPQRTPEIMDADLAPLLLETALWGTTDLSELSWVTAPPSNAVVQSRKLLQQLHALDDQGHITPHGRAIAELGLHPRMAHMIISSKRLGLSSIACHLAALLTEGDPLKGPPGWYCADIQLRLDALRHQQEQVGGARLDRARLRRIIQTADQIGKKVSMLSSATTEATAIPNEPVGLLLAFAYPDRIAKRQNEGARTFLLANGRGAYFPQVDTLAQEAFLVIPDIDGGLPRGKVYLAALFDEEDLQEFFRDEIQEQEEVWWEEKKQSVLARKQRLFGELILEDRSLSKPDPSLIRKALLQGIRQTGITCFPWSPSSRQWQARVLFLRQVEGTRSTLPNVSDTTLLHSLEQWFEPFANHVTQLDHVKRIDLEGLLQGLLTWDQQRSLDRLMPTHLTVPSGSRILLDYLSSDPPILAVRLQELFGCQDTPTVMGGRIPVLLHILSPARRPVQVTQDLAGFWRSSYYEVRKDLRGRYPKHAWPDDPLQAQPSRRVKKRT